MTKSPLKPEAIKLLRRVKKHILAEPKRLNMNYWFRDVGKGAKTYFGDIGDNNSRLLPAPPCGTVGCIRGWADHLGSTSLRGMISLEQAEKLFFFKHWNRGGDGWPESFSSRYLKAKTPKKRAEMTAERIEYFIRTGE